MVVVLHLVVTTFQDPNCNTMIMKSMFVILLTIILVIVYCSNNNTSKLVLELNKTGEEIGIT
jgi:hypothetical protein